jgi:hypothetical protein
MLYGAEKSLINSGDMKNTLNINYNKYFQNIILYTVKIFLLIITLWFVGKSLYNAMIQVDWSEVLFQPVQTLAGMFIITLAIFVGTWGIRYIYSHLDTVHLSWTQAFILFSVPPVGKYLPGKFLSLAGHTAIAKKFGIRIMTSASAILLITGLGLAGAILIAITLLLIQSPIQISDRILQISIVSIVILTILILHPTIYWQMMNRALRVLHQPPIEVKMQFRTMAVLFFAILFQNGLYLLGVSVIASGTVTFPASFLPSLVGSLCLASVAGFLAFFAPAGIGVREGILLVMLSPIAGPGIAGLIAIIIRLIQTASDCILGLTGFIMLHFLEDQAQGKSLRT